MSFASPFDDAAAWNDLTLVVSRSGTSTAFTWKTTDVAVDGDVTNGWDVKKSGGADGARTTDTGYEPAELSLSWLLWTQEHFRAWEAFVRAAKPKPGRETKPVVMVVHPSVQIFSTVLFRLKTIAFPEFEEVDQWTAKLELVEYFAEPKVAKPEPKRGEVEAPTIMQQRDKPSTKVKP